MQKTFFYEIALFNSQKNWTRMLFLLTFAAIVAFVMLSFSLLLYEVFPYFCPLPRVYFMLSISFLWAEFAA